MGLCEALHLMVGLYEALHHFWKVPRVPAKGSWFDHLREGKSQVKSHPHFVVAFSTSETLHWVVAKFSQTSFLSQGHHPTELTSEFHLNLNNFTPPMMYKCTQLRAGKSGWLSLTSHFTFFSQKYFPDLNNFFWLSRNNFKPSLLEIFYFSIYLKQTKKHPS